MDLKFQFYRSDDENLEVYLDEQFIAEANHDHHGWAGMGLLEDAINAVAKQLGMEVVES